MSSITGYTLLAEDGEIGCCKDFLIDEKVPRHKRDMLPLVCDGEGIIWVAGVRISDRCRVGGNTRKVLFLKFTPDFPFI